MFGKETLKVFIFLRFLKRIVVRFLNLLKTEYQAAQAHSSGQLSRLPKVPLEEDYKKQASKYPLLIARFQWLLSQLEERFQRPAYAWGVICGVDLACELKIPGISVVEYGVAGGNGLLALQAIGIALEKIYPIKIEVYGFDSGKGLPQACDYRDLPHLWSANYYGMDQEKLKSLLTRAHLVLGEVQRTIPQWLKCNPAPVAFAAFDLDLYSSTMDAFALLEADARFLLPRVHCYFDDIMGYSYGDFNGERLAISTFNKKTPLRKISPIYGLKYFLIQPGACWMEQVYLAHLFDHPLYSQKDGMVTLAGQNLPLAEPE